ncbi:tRNA pseudouridine synthase 10 [Angomonas deanei]|nr:tRNA pseudouridine synthase 10 [Angomonas deanei]|eukprot:EPY32925.1 tRNA pseudouridine synthase 10 [Angomonas deanei]
MLELRVRMLQYLSVPHEDLVTRVSSTLPPPPSSSTKFLGIATYFNEINSQHGGATGSLDDGTSPIKKFKSEDNNNSNTPNKHLIPHALVYSSNNDSITADVFCRYIPSEMLLDTKTVPAVYCSNRPGVVLTFAVILDHVLPFIKETKMYGGEVPARGDEPAPKEESALVQCVVEHANIYLIGNYCKLMRYLSQSPWFSDGERIGTYSLQEVIANPILPFFFPEGVTPLPPVAYADQFRDAAGMDDDAIIQSITRKCMGKLPPGQASAWQSVDPALVGYQRVYGYGRYKFHSAGREDVDVRMLGTGRPFVLEIVSPSREQYTPEDLTRLQEAVNANHSGGVAVRDLRTTDSLITVRLARHSESKVKRYRAVVWCSRPIPNPDEDEHFLKANQIKDLSIEQKTPLRVLHRRSLHARPRMIHSLTLTPINPHWFVLDVETQAGTYVKEFVHGDMGRTVPNLGMLLQGKTDIIQLDVVDMAIQDLEK